MKVLNHLVVLVYLQDNLLVGQPTTLSCRTNFVRIFYTSIIQTCFQQMAMMICLIHNRFNMIDIYTNWHLIFVQCYNSTLRVCRVNHAFFKVNHISVYNVNKCSQFSSQISKKWLFNQVLNIILNKWNETAQWHGWYSTFKKSTC